MVPKQRSTEFSANLIVNPGERAYKSARQQDYRTPQRKAARIVGRAAQTVILGGTNCDPRRNTEMAGYGRQQSRIGQNPLIYSNLVVVPENSHPRARGPRPASETVIPGGKTVILGGTNRDPPRKISCFSVISGGTNHDPRRNKP